MTEPARKLSYTFVEYLAVDAASETKHEFVNGEIFAMTGGTLEHGRLSVNVQSELRNALRGRRCVVFNTDVRVRVLATGLGTYPDASVVCGPPQVDPEDKNTVINPVVLVEVLSDSTERYDRDDKRAHYRQNPLPPRLPPRVPARASHRTLPPQRRRHVDPAGRPRRQRGPPRVDRLQDRPSTPSTTTRSPPW